MNNVLLESLIIAMGHADAPWVRDLIRSVILRRFPHEGPKALNTVGPLKITDSVGNGEAQVVFEYPQGPVQSLVPDKKKAQDVVARQERLLAGVAKQGMWQQFASMTSDELQAHFLKDTKAMKRFIREHGGKIHQNASLKATTAVLEELIQSELSLHEENTAD